MFLLLALSDPASAGIPYTEEELLEISEVAASGTIIESNCLSHGIDSNGIETYMYEATIAVTEVLINTNSLDMDEQEITLLSVNTVYPEGADQPACDSNDTAHPVGEAGTYYLYPNSQDSFSLHMGGFIGGEDSDPLDEPNCPDLEQPAEPSDDPLQEEDKEAQGCSSLGTSLWMFLLPLLGLRRRL